MALIDQLTTQHVGCSHPLARLSVLDEMKQHLLHIWHGMDQVIINTAVDQ